MSPKAAIWINVLYATLTGITTAGADVMWPGHGAQVLAWAGLLALPLNGYLHAVSSSDAGPLGK
jgi:hypothetical protein